MRASPRADDMRPRPRRAAGLPEVQEGWQAPGCNAAPACPALAPAAAAGKLNAKLKTDFRCYPNNGHAATASAGPFCAMKRLMHRSKKSEEISPNFVDVPKSVMMIAICR